MRLMLRFRAEESAEDMHEFPSTKLARDGSEKTSSSLRLYNMSMTKSTSNSLISDMIGPSLSFVGGHKERLWHSILA